MYRIALAALGLAVGSGPSAAAQVWVDVTPPLTQVGGDVAQVAFDPRDGLHLFVRESWNVHESFDGGRSWSLVATAGLPGPITALALSPDGVLLVGVLRQVTGAAPAPVPYVFQRTAGGWSPAGPQVAVPPPSGGTTSWQVGALAFGRGRPKLVALVLNEQANFEYGASALHFLSDDGGASWAGPTADAGVPRSLTLVESAGTAQLAYTCSFYPSTGTETSWRLSSGWSAPVAPGLHACGEIAFHATRRDPAELLRSSYDHYNAGATPTPIERSLDGGVTWTALGGAGQFASLTQSSIDPDILLRNPHPAFGGPEMSLDGGATWTALTVPTTVHPGPFGFALSPDEARLYAYPVNAFATAQSHKLLVTDLIAPVGASECAATANQTGQVAAISAHGSSSLAASQLDIVVVDLPSRVALLLLVSRVAGHSANPGGSFGDLCLGGPIGRFPASRSTTSGAWFLDHDASGLPTPGGPVAALAGETWRYQAWFRDLQAGAQGSNFSDAVAVTFAP